MEELIRVLDFHPRLVQPGASYVVGIKYLSRFSECVVEQRFVAVKGQWMGDIGPEGMICVYASTESRERER